MNKVGRLTITGTCVAASMLATNAVSAHAAGSTDTSGSDVAATLFQKPSRHAHAYFISPSGSDSNPGTKRAPFKSLMQAQDAASAGDIVYIRGGVYDQFTIPETDNPFEDVYHYVNDINKSDITYMAYPGDDRPVFDFSTVPTDQRVAAFYVDEDVTGVNFIGFDVTGVKVGEQKQSEAFRIAGGANVMNMRAYDNEATGFYYTMEGTGVALNSDAYNNIGPTALSAGNSDGFGAHANAVWFINDRSWNNSDDGYDSITSTGRVTYVNDWSFDNTGNQDGLGDQNGFKVGGYAYTTEGLPDPIPLHTVIGCLSVSNGANNFYANHQPGQSAYWINNTADNPGYGANFNMLERVSPTSPDNISGYREVLHNNVAYSGETTANDDTSAANETNNTWTIDGGLEVASKDFASTDASQLTAPRKRDGSLPDVSYLQPTHSSELSKHGLGYTADRHDSIATLQKLVQVYAQSGDIDSDAVSKSLLIQLRDHNLLGFTLELKAQSGKHVSTQASQTLQIVEYALAGR